MPLGVRRQARVQHGYAEPHFHHDPAVHVLPSGVNLDLTGRSAPRKRTGAGAQWMRVWGDCDLVGCERLHWHGKVG